MTKSTTRVQLDLSPKEVARLNAVMEACDIHTRKELFNNAFTALEWMVRERRCGREVYSTEQDSEIRYALQLPALNNVELGADAAEAKCGAGSHEMQESEDFFETMPRRAVG
ncbi:MULTISPECIES: hypothetical protein [unclassified Marinovum]